jgi:hypothetical protein
VTGEEVAGLLAEAEAAGWEIRRDAKTVSAHRGTVMRYASSLEELARMMTVRDVRVWVRPDRPMVAPPSGTE